MTSLLTLTLVLALTTFAARARAADDPDFKLVAKVQPLTVGLPGTIDVRIDVAGGYHWNDEYPAKIEIVTPPSGLDLPKASLSQAAGDFKATSPARVDTALPAIAKRKLSAPVQVDARFSICNERVCLIKKASVTVQVSTK